METSITQRIACIYEDVI